MNRVLIVDDSRIIRSIIESRIALSPDFELTASIENAANAEIVCMSGRVDLILMDVCTADDESGLAAAVRIRKNFPDIKILIMTSMPEYSFLQKARNAGCSGFWYKEYGESDLLDICRRIMSGESVWPDETPVINIGQVKSSELTERELEILRELALGSKYEEISSDLGISVNTVKYHVKNLLQKTGFKNTLQLVSNVVEKRLILPKY